MTLDTVLNVNCLIGMNDIPNKSVDMIFADVPYGTTKNKWDCLIPLNDFVIIGKKIIYENDIWKICLKNGTSLKEKLDWFHENKQLGFWSHCNRIIKDHGVIALWAQAPFSHTLAQSNRDMFRYEWVIEKTKATGQYNANKMPMKAHENILIFYKHLPAYHPQKTTGHKRKVATAKQKRNCKQSTNYNEVKPTTYDSTERYPRDVLKYKWDTQTSSLHPTQKPIKVCEDIILTYTNPGDTVLDTCTGSGTIPKAAQNTGRHFLAFETEKKYYKTTIDRLNKKEE